MRNYYDPSVSWEELCESDHGMTKAKSLYENPRGVRENVLQSEVYDDNSIIRWAVFPMDVRYAYATCARSVWNSPRPDLQPLRFGNDKFLVFPAYMSGKEVGFPVIFSSVIGSYHLMSSQTMFFPFFDYAPSAGILSEQKTANLSDEARNWMSELGFCNPDTDDDVAALPWFHILAICYSRRYAEGNIEMLKVDYPKIPMPSNSDGLLRSSKLGKRVAALLNVEQAAHDLIPRGVKKLAGVFGKDYRVSKKWTKVTKRGISPGKGIVSLPRDWDETEVPVLQEAFASLEIDEQRGFELLGKAHDIYLNDNGCYWKGVPEAVWKCRIGTRQVIQKWLSYRSETLIGRDLDVDEVRHVREIIRRLTTLILMACDLDANYDACCEDTYQWHAD